MHQKAADVQPMVNCAMHARRRTILSRSAPTRTEELLNRSKISKRSKCNAPRPRVHHLDTSSKDDEDEYAHWGNAMKFRKKQREDAKCLMLFVKQEIIFQIDTGATINTLPAKFANEIKPYKRVPTMWNKSLMKPFGICRKNVKTPKTRKIYSVEFVIFKHEDDCQPLLGLRTSTQMGLVEIK